MKRIIVFVLTLGIVMGSAGVVSAQEAETASNQAGASSDLTGNWIQKDVEGSELIQTGIIQDGTIDLFWVHGDGSGSNLYWSGDFDVPEENGASFTSTNTKSKTGYALMASKEDTKEFTYADGELRYTVSMLGQEIPVVLVKAEAAATSSSGGSSAEQAAAGKPVEFVSSNYSWYKRSGDSMCSLYYTLEIQNPNENYAVKNPAVQVTVRAEDGSIITTREDVLPSVAAGDTYIYGNTMTYEGNVPDELDMIISNGNSAYVPQDESGVIPQNMLAVSNVSEIKNDQYIKYTGEITNNSTINLESAYAIVIFKKGDERIGGISTIIDSLSSGATRPFEIDMSRDILDYDSYEVYALSRYPMN